MNHAVVVFTTAVAAASALCYALMTRAERRRLGRTGPRGHSTSDDGGYSGTSASEGASFAGWFSPSGSTDSSGNPLAEPGGDGVAGDSGGDSGGDGGGGAAD